jgi:hypothetical protein
MPFYRRTNREVEEKRRGGEDVIEGVSVTKVHRVLVRSFVMKPLTMCNLIYTNK